uniref:Uncharacterized protein n=1 Tax=viral metagenome TaxID=1070528 RepID=A0A6C0DBZ6_9ZZZZ
MYYISDDDETASLTSDNENDDDHDDILTLSNSSESDIDDLSLSNNSILIEFDEYSDDEEDEYTIDEIHRDEELFLDSEKRNDHYYIGLYKHIRYDNLLLLLNCISAKSFYKYSYIHVLKYLYYYSLVRLYQPNVEIMKLYILNNGTYSVVLKTHWIRLIQRHWRKALQIRKNMMKNQMHVSSLYYREIRGKFPRGLNNMPMLSGLMGQYAICKKSSNIRID